VAAAGEARVAASGEARGPSSSVFGNPGTRRPLTMADCSFMYQAPPEVKRWKLHDFVTVQIEEKATMTSEGQVDQRKKIEGAMTLTDWLMLRKWSLVPDPQSSGDPKVAGVVDNKYRAQANLQNKDLFQASVQCIVADIRPNGTLVIEGHSRVKVDDEEWELSISGVVRPDDILPNNTVKSEKVAEKWIVRRSAGQGRDGIRRGWLGKLLDQFQLF
jgi:flagellar L-ring protein precursor FlgH